jgi:hypothetical protein
MRIPGRRSVYCGIVALLLALILSNLAVGASPETQSGAESFAPRTRVMLFEPGTGQWVLTTFAQAKPGNEFCFIDHLYRVVDADKAQIVPNVNAGKLLDADLPYGNAGRRPSPDDVVQVLHKDSQFVSHSLFSVVQPGVIIRFQGKAYSVKCRRRR